MPNTFDWEDPEEIGIELAEKHPDTDPLTVRFTDLLKWVTDTHRVLGRSEASNEGKLEAIQMAWLEEHQDRKGCIRLPDRGCLVNLADFL